MHLSELSMSVNIVLTRLSKSSMSLNTILTTRLKTHIQLVLSRRVCIQDAHVYESRPERHTQKNMCMCINTHT